MPVIGFDSPNCDLGTRRREERMTPQSDRGSDLRKFMLSVLAFIVLAGVGYMVVTMYMR